MRARKSLGQNFLVDPNIQRKIVDALEPDARDEILEIGPGTGAITALLAGRARRLIAVEVDPRMVDRLRAELADRTGFELIHRSILDLELDQVTRDVRRLKVVGNIPYNLTSPIIFHLLERRNRAAVIILMVQREVADRILASPGAKAYGALSVGIRVVARVERLFHVSRQAFRPVPDVDSTVIRILPHHPPPLSEADEAAVRDLTRTAFNWRRKQLQKILRAAPEYGLPAQRIAELTAAAGLDPAQRPETLSPEEFVRLARVIGSSGADQ